MTMTIRGSRVGRASELRTSTCGIKLTVAAKSACNLSSCRGSESASSLGRDCNGTRPLADCTAPHRIACTMASPSAFLTL